MSDLSDKLAQPSSHPAAGRRGRHSHPDGWEPGIDTKKGEITARTDEPDGPDWTHVLDNLGLDPADWQVVDDQAEVRSWDVPNHGRMWYHKAKVTPARTVAGVDIDQLAATVRKRGPLRAAQSPPPYTGGGFFCAVLTDWQAGKGTSGGAQQLVDRLERLGAAVEQRVTWLRDGDVDVPGLALLLGGDLVEGCGGHYAMQTFEVELDQRQQTKLVRRMLVELVDRWAPLFDRIVVAAAAGNHGEKRSSSKAWTSWSDNLDVEIPEQVAEILAANPDRYGHVSFLLPEADSLTVTVDLDGLVVGVAHGHQCNRGSGVPKRVWSWWERMAANRHPIGDADVLVTGHHHHTAVKVDGTHDGSARTWLQAPALDGGSPWWQQTGGGYTSAGTLTFVAQDGRWDHLHVIPADGDR